MLGRLVQMNFAVQKKKAPEFQVTKKKLNMFGARVIFSPSARTSHTWPILLDPLENGLILTGDPHQLLAPVDLMIDLWMTLRVCCFSLEGRLTNVYIYIYILYIYIRIVKLCYI